MRDFILLSCVILLGFVEVSVASKPASGAKSKGSKSSTDVDADEDPLVVNINWRRHYDEDFIRRLYIVVDPDNSTTTNTTNTTHNTTLKPFMCTYCSLATDDKSCHERYQVCESFHGCFRHVFIKYGQRFLDKGCWHEPVPSPYGQCTCTVEVKDKYSCFCETCPRPMCNSEILMTAATKSHSGRLTSGTVVPLLVVVVLSLFVQCDKWHCWWW